MYLPLTYSSTPAAPGLGYYVPFNANLRVSEYYPPPYDSLLASAGLGCCGRNRAGLGDAASIFDTLTGGTLSTAQATTNQFLADNPQLGTILTWSAIGVGVLLLFAGAHSGKRDALRKARSRYEEEVSKIQREYTVSGRAKRLAKRIPRVRLEKA